MKSALSNILLEVSWLLTKSKLLSAQNQIQGDPIRKYHMQLRHVLSTFASANERLRNITFPLVPTKSICVDVVTCLLFVIQDIQEGNMLQGQYGNHSSGIQRHCRVCDVNYNNLDNHLVQCSYLTSDFLNEIAARADDAILHKHWSQHQLDNACKYVPMAGPILLFGATPVETMHCIRKV